MLSGTEKANCSKAFALMWDIWKRYGIRHSEADEWAAILLVSDEIMKMFPDDSTALNNTMRKTALTLLTGLEKRADELREEEQQAHGKGNNGS